MTNTINFPAHLAGKTKVTKALVDEVFNHIPTVAKLLKQERERCGWSQLDMADAGLVSVSVQSNYESGRCLPSLGYLMNLADSGADIRCFFRPSKGLCLLRYNSTSMAKIKSKHRDACFFLEDLITLNRVPVPQLPRLLKEHEKRFTV